MTLHRAVAVGALTAGLLLPFGPVSASNSAAARSDAVAAPARSHSRITVHPFYHQQKYRHPFRVSGQVRYTADGKVYAKAGVKVSLLRRPAGSNRWSSVGTDRTSRTTKPTYAFSVVARGNSTYRVRFAGTSRLQPSRARAKVFVHRKVPSHLNRPRPSVLKLVGHVEPAWRHNRVRLVKRTCGTCTWRVVRQQRTSGRSQFRFGLGAPRNGSWYFRVQVPGTIRFASSVSATYRTYS